MITPKSPSDYFGAALDHLPAALKPFLTGKLSERYGPNWWAIAAVPHLPEYAGRKMNDPDERMGSNDAYLWLKVLLGNKDICFAHDPSIRESRMIEEILEGRNRWAHGSQITLQEAGALIGHMDHILCSARVTNSAALQSLLRELRLYGVGGILQSEEDLAATHAISPDFRAKVAHTSNSPFPFTEPAPHTDHMNTIDSDITQVQALFVRHRQREVRDLVRTYTCAPDELLVFFDRKTDRVDICPPGDHVWNWLKFDTLARLKTTQQVLTQVIATEFIDPKGFIVNIQVAVKMFVEIKHEEKHVRNTVFRFESSYLTFTNAITPIVKSEVNRLFFAQGRCSGTFDADSMDNLTRLFAAIDESVLAFKVSRVAEVTLGDPAFFEKARPIAEQTWRAKIEQSAIREETGTLESAEEYRDLLRRLEREQQTHQIGLNENQAQSESRLRQFKLKDIADTLEIIKNMGEDKLLALGLIDKEALKLFFDYEINKAKVDLARFDHLAVIAERFMTAARSRGVW